jgi:hypothetical protein
MELLVARFCSLCYRNRQSEMKGCTRAKVGAGPQATAVRFDKRPGDCQTHPRALRKGRIASDPALLNLPGLQWLALFPFMAAMNKSLAQISKTPIVGAHSTAFNWASQIGCPKNTVDSDSIPLTQEFLSEMLGVRRTTVTVVARVLQEAGLIRYRRGRIEIIDRCGLEEAACECYSAIRKRTDQDLPKADV